MTRFIRKTLSFLPIAALSVLMSGCNGGGSGPSPSPNPTPTLAPIAAFEVVARPVFDGARPAVIVTYPIAVPGVAVEGQNIAGFLIYRGTTPGFAINSDSLQQFLPGSSSGFVDNTARFQGRTVSIARVTDTGGGGIPEGRNFVISDTSSTTRFSSTTIDASPNGIKVRFNARPLANATQYFYAVQGIALINGKFVVSQASPYSGGATAALAPVVTAVNPDLSNFSVTINVVPDGLNVLTVQVSADNSFPDDGIFVFQTNNPSFRGQLSTLLDLGAITVPNFRPGSGQQLYVRVLARNSSDSPGPALGGIPSRPFAFTPTSPVPAT